jgi:hypothetical protein
VGSQPWADGTIYANGTFGLGKGFPGAFIAGMKNGKLTVFDTEYEKAAPGS